MTQDTKTTAPVEGETPQPQNTAADTSELDASKAENVSGGTDVCNIADISGQISATYDNLVDATSHIIERVANAMK